MRRPTLLALASTLSLSLCASSPAWSQTRPSPPPTQAGNETVPAARDDRSGRAATPARRVPWYMVDDEAPQTASYLGAHSTRPRRTISDGDVLLMAGLSVGGGILGGLTTGLVGIPLAATGSQEAGFGTMYVGYSIATALSVYGLGSLWDGDGNVVAPLVGAVGGAALGWSIQFWMVDPGDAPPAFSAMVITALLSTTGALVGYMLSTSSDQDGAGRNRQARLVPTAHPLRDGLVLGLGGTF